MKFLKGFLLSLAALILFAPAARCQAIDSTLHANQYPGATVAAKVIAAMSTCPTHTSALCVIVLDPSLANWATGTMPALCANCQLLDDRTGYAGGTSMGLPAVWTDGSNGSNMTRLGVDALANQTTGYGNTAIGAYDLKNNDIGTWLVGLGDHAMEYATSVAGSYPYSNTAVGSSALGSVLDGPVNTAFGTNCLLNLTTGYSNDCSGKDAGWSLSSGYQNSFHGVNAGTCNNGYGNVVDGYRALYGLSANTSGIADVSVGSSGGAGYKVGDVVTLVQVGASGGQVTVLEVAAGGVVTALSPSTMPGTGYSLANNLATTGGSGSGLLVDTTEIQTIEGCPSSLDQGSLNTVNGYEAMQYNGGTGSGGTGSNNVADGAYALFANTTGGSNTAVGINALTNNVDGSNNTAAGNGACVTSAHGQDNVCIGHSADLASGSLNNTIAIGHGAIASQSGEADLGSAANTQYTNLFGHVVIGGTSPTTQIVGCALGTYLKADGTGCGTPSGTFTADKEWVAQTLCTPATSTDSNCTGTFTYPSSFAFADTSYGLQIQANSSTGANVFAVVTAKTTTTFGYTVTCTFNCSSYGTLTFDIRGTHP